MFVILQTHRCSGFVRAECVLKKFCIFVIVHIKEYPVKYDVVTNDDLFKVHYNRPYTKFKLYFKCNVMIKE